ncbi:unnamed protein product [Ceutorhynchus assimilis]|uniref:RWD domain-containing protein n=1 Tax=Ceutorhynchus assimilis TaxID=467358 RepID=A0A9N9MDU2_9CUCU|nr:unnamed protein product [Ceutorhynchus assimilis]
MTEEQNLLENLQIQLDELDSLQATFYNPGEIKVEDLASVQGIKDYIAGKTKILPPCLDFTVNLVVEDTKFEMCVSLGHDYPLLEPEIFVRNHRLNRAQHEELNRNIGEFLRDLPKGEPCIFTLISWLQDNATDYIESKIIPTQCQKKNEELVRYWIYSHHIYSKTKRRALIDSANELNVSGFVMPGKPGIICVEGDSCDVATFWQGVKSMNWKKIFCKITESNKEDTKSANFLKFKNFVEIVFDNHGPKFNHMDMGEFNKYLEQHELGYIFKDIFGMEDCGLCDNKSTNFSTLCSINRFDF